MCNILEKEVKFDLDAIRLRAFQLLKQILIEVVILILPDRELPFELMCDASDVAVDGVLGKRKNRV